MSSPQLLVRLPDVSLERVAARRWVDALPMEATSLGLFHGAETRLSYLRLALQTRPDPRAEAAILAAARQICPNAETALLELTVELDGADAGLEASWHYEVETDVTADAEADFNAWYLEEHLPGLASVPGTVRARRLIDHDGSPRYHACYDLNRREAFSSPAWLAVRATPWSDRVRPCFRNTRRTMFRRVS